MTEPLSPDEILTPDGVRVQVPAGRPTPAAPGGPVPAVLRVLTAGPVLVAAAAGMAAAAVGAEVARSMLRAWGGPVWPAPVRRTDSSGPGFDVRVTSVEFRWPPQG